MRVSLVAASHASAVLAFGTADVQFYLAFEQNWGVPSSNDPIA
ncbi:MAG TPA: hypothetical protein VFD92_03120 [Candidatus Binatia bacterium]|nr:hypothetical protein [Candidatus Binatia bacterium]